MAIGIGSGNLGILRNLQETQKKRLQSLQNLSSGSRLSSNQNPAGLAIANSLDTQSRSLQTVNRGIDYTQGALQTASGGLNEIRDNLQRLREIAVQASNGTISDSDRANLQQEFDQLSQNINEISSNTKFGNTSLLDGSFSQSVQTGANAGESQDISISGVSSSDLGINDQGIATQSSAQDALSAIDSALAQVNAEAAKIGTNQNALEFRQSANAVQAENLAAAQSQIADTDIAEELSSLNAENVKQQFQIQVLKQQQQSQADITKQTLKGFGQNSKFSKKI